MSRCTKATIHKDNLRSNLLEIKNYVAPDIKICVAVKADSYGHNAVLTAKICEELGIGYLAVATVQEAIELRNADIKLNIILLSLCTPEEFIYLFENKITPLVFTKEHISLMSNSANEFFKNSQEKFPVFLAIDTGMGRIGCYPEESGEEAKLITESIHLSLMGVISHLCVADSLLSNNQVFTKEQLEKFKLAIKNIKDLGINPGICSIGNSAALLNNTDMHFDMVRPGIITYGYFPDEITEKHLNSQGKKITLKPVLSLETKVVAIKHFKKGQSISYGRTYVCEQETDIAILPIGYADGLLRRFSPGLNVTINGKNYPIRGRICMDQCMVDIGLNNKEVKVFDKVMIFGPPETGALNTADTLAKIGGTISYEVLTSITKRVEKTIK